MRGKRAKEIRKFCTHKSKELGIEFGPFYKFIKRWWTGLSIVEREAELAKKVKND